MKAFVLAAIAAATALSACAPNMSAVTMDAPAPASASFMAETLPPMRLFGATPAAAPTRSNTDMASDFLDLTFRLESGRTVPVLTRFEGPISVRVTGLQPPSLMPDLTSLLSRLRNEAGLDIFYTNATDASITIEAIPRATLQRAVPRAACFVVPRVSSWSEYLAARRGPDLDWTTLTRRDHAAIFVPADVAPQELRDCLHEELAQAIGPLNDLYLLPDSVFNDDNIHSVLTGFDMLVLRAYYAPELRNGMTRSDVAARLPAIFARYNPAGQYGKRGHHNDTSRDWINSIETALSTGGSPVARRQSAERAIALANAFGWDGVRVGFGQYAYGRLELRSNPQAALEAFRQAFNAYGTTPSMRLHSAHVAAQLAAFSLSSGDTTTTLNLVEAALPAAQQGQNAALMSSLLMFKAEALELAGQRQEAAAVRLDSLGWARYAFGSERSVRARMAEIAALAPPTTM